MSKGGTLIDMIPVLTAHAIKLGKILAEEGGSRDTGLIASTSWSLARYRPESVFDEAEQSDKKCHQELYLCIFHGEICAYSNVRNQFWYRNECAIKYDYLQFFSSK